MQCVGTAGSRGRYACQCPPGKLGECAGHSSLSFSGNSYIKPEAHFSRPTLGPTLEEGKLWFHMDCGGLRGQGVAGASGPPGGATLGISGRPINDGTWHTVTLELSRNSSSLALDDSYVERRRGTPRLQPLGPDGAIFFGAQVQPANSRSLTDTKKGPQVLDGFQGCLDSVTLNDNELPLQNKRSRYAEVVGLTELKLGCVLYPDSCLKQPCLHGATCTSLPSGGFACSCSPQYTGGRCETEITACVPNPCQNSGACKPIGNAFPVQLPQGLQGPHGQALIPRCPGGRERVRAPGTPKARVRSGGACVNTRGSFYSRLRGGLRGPRCGLRPVVVPDMQAGHAVVGKEELIGMAAVLLVIVALVVLFVAFRKRVFRKEYARGDLSLVQDPATAALLHKAGGGTRFETLRCGAGDPLSLYAEAGLGPAAAAALGVAGPPQVPVRPMAYTPCFPGEPPARATLDRQLMMAAAADGRVHEHTEMSTFHPESPRILAGSVRRGVVMVDMAEEVTCFSGSNKGSNSAAYHWDTSDWMPSTRLPDIEEVPGYEVGGPGSLGANGRSASNPRLGARGGGGGGGGGSTRELESDYYLGGYDIDSDYPPPHEDHFLCQDQLPPPLPSAIAGAEDYPEGYDGTSPGDTGRPVSKDSTLSSVSHSNSHSADARPHFHPSQYLPPHQLPLGEAGPGLHHRLSSPFPMGGLTPGSGDTDEGGALLGGGRLSVGGASTASDLSAPLGFDDSEAGNSDFDSMDELRRGVTVIIDSQQQTEV
ncbi:hypothetical protein CRUP_021660 [Coryphaenoides rupestris]|nr:hypothetical protein CRUP_021660 [Coryphaenoides rupestris]